MIHQNARMGTAQFTEYFERKVRYTIRHYHLFSKKDRVAVALSGGKDSMSCLNVLHKCRYNVEAITIDPCIGAYTAKNLENARELCKKLGIKLHEISFRDEFGKSLRYLQSAMRSRGREYSPCMLCGILKRYLLNKHARVLGFDAIATGHNLDDEAQAFMMNVFRNDFGRAMRQGPVSGIVKSRGFVRRVKPLYLLSEAETKRYSKSKGFAVNYGICPCSAKAYRRQYINILDEFEKAHPHVKYNIVRFHEQLKGLCGNVSGDVLVCSACGEPTAASVCKTCEILRILER